MQIWIILVDLGLAILCFLCGFGVAAVAWMAHVNEPSDGKPGCSKFSLRFWGSLISLLLFGLGLYDLQQLAAERFVGWRIAGTQASMVGIFLAISVHVFLSCRRHGQIQRLLDNGQTEEAVELLERWIQAAKQPQADLHSMLGMIHMNSEQPELAEKELRRAVEISEELAMYLSHLAIALNQLDRTDEALRLIERAAEKDPSNRWVYLHNQCWFLARAGRVEQARELLPDVEQHDQRMMARMSPLDQRRMAETLSEMQQLCDRPGADSVPSD